MIDSQSPTGIWQIDKRIETLEADLATARAELETLQSIRRHELQRRMSLNDRLADHMHREANEALARSAELRARVDAIHRSNSWRVTAPMRAVKRAFQKGLQKIHGLPSELRLRVMTGLRAPMTWAAAYLSSRPKLRASATRILRTYLPGLTEGLRSVYHSKILGGPAVPPFQSRIGLQTLSPRARLIFDDIKAALQEGDHAHRD